MASNAERLKRRYPSSGRKRSDGLRKTRCSRPLTDLTIAISKAMTRRARQVERGSRRDDGGETPEMRVGKCRGEGGDEITCSLLAKQCRRGCQQGSSKLEMCVCVCVCVSLSSRTL